LEPDVVRKEEWKFIRILIIFKHVCKNQICSLPGASRWTVRDRGCDSIGSYLFAGIKPSTSPTMCTLNRGIANSNKLYTMPLKESMLWELEEWKKP
jgi:hypothetical protein